MEERETYKEIRQAAMESAYWSCRSYFSPARVPQTPDIPPRPFARFFSETYDCFEDDLLELMFRTLELILWQGQELPKINEICTHSIECILSRNSFEDLVADIPEEEAEELRTDLILLKFLPDPRQSAKA